MADPLTPSAERLREGPVEEVAASTPSAWKRIAHAPWLPVALLFVVAVLSLGARMVFIEEPCGSPCRGPRAAGLIFDEPYYVDAARVIDGHPPPEGYTYADAQPGVDPNAEHPQLGKIIMAAGIRIFGDRPFGWRLGSLQFGTAAILGMYLLVRAAKGGKWLALGAASVMAVDNLLMVHGRIATLDIYAVTFMIFGAALYLRRRPLLAGVVLGIGATTKLVVFYLFVSLFLLEAMQWTRAWRRRRTGLEMEAGETDPPVKRDPWWRRHWPGRALVITTLAALLSYGALLWVLDLTVTPVDPGTGNVYRDPISHTKHMLNFAANVRSPNGPEGAASYPWQWMINKQPITYYSVFQDVTGSSGLIRKRELVAFKGAMNPFIIFLAIPALFLCASLAWKEGETASMLAVAWYVGTFLPFVLFSVVDERTSYLHYMVVVMPGIYLATARLFSSRSLPRAASFGWAVALLVGLISLYPFRTLSGL